MKLRYLLLLSVAIACLGCTRTVLRQESRYAGSDGSVKVHEYAEVLYDRSLSPYGYLGTRCGRPALTRGPDFFTLARETPMSTFSLDVDTASYALLRRSIREGKWPSDQEVRVEEWINYFGYDLPSPQGDEAFAVALELAQCPWNPRHRLLRVGLASREVQTGQRPPANLVLLIDTSGSMKSADRLPLVKNALVDLVAALDARDRVSLVTFSHGAKEVLPSTPGSEKGVIASAIMGLRGGGPSQGGKGLKRAYEIAEEQFLEGGVNRVIVATDGEFGDSYSMQREVETLVFKGAARGIYMTMLGFGVSEADRRLEWFTNRANGSYAVIDSVDEARKVLKRELSQSIVPVADDVKIQVEFNPGKVGAYRLIGYANRRLTDEAFNDPRVDAGDVGAGDHVTALYEIVPSGLEDGLGRVDALRYTRPAGEQAVYPNTDELLTFKISYRNPGSASPRRMVHLVRDTHVEWGVASDDFRWAAAVACFGLVAARTPFAGEASVDQALELARGSLGRDVNGERREFVDLVERARSITGMPGSNSPGPVAQR